MLQPRHNILVKPAMVLTAIVCTGICCTIRSNPNSFLHWPQVGTFSEGGSFEDCKPCPFGYTSEFGATSREECHPVAQTCPVGQIAPPGAVSREQCGCIPGFGGECGWSYMPKFSGTGAPGCYRLVVRMQACIGCTRGRHKHTCTVSAGGVWWSGCSGW